MKVSLIGFKKIKLNVSSFYDFKRRKAAVKEPETVKWLRKNIKKYPDLTMIDIGANVGGYSLIACSMSPKVTCISIEPFPPTFLSLSKNIILNNFSQRILPICAAVGSTEKKSNQKFKNFLKFNFDRWVSGVAEHPNNSKNSFLSPTIDDDFINSKINSKTILLKIDIDGGEISVLNSLSKILSNNFLKSILIECSIKNSVQVTEILSKFNFNIVNKEAKKNNKELNLIFEK